MHVIEAPLASPQSSRLRVLALALSLVLGQTLCLCAFAGTSSPSAAYLRLCQWDSHWYAHIVQHGYRSTLPPIAQDRDQANVAFFPGYPLAAQLLQRLLGVSALVALLLAAQLACWGFWTYVLLFLQRWRVPFGLALATVVLLVVHPAAFFLVVGYSESLFLFGVLGFLYWSSAGSRTGWALAALHGILMTATRLVGLGLVICPLVQAVVSGPELAKDRRSGARILVAIGLAGVASLGALLFFTYCQWRFGHWNLYMETQRIGWQIEPDYLAVFRPDTYRLFFPTVADGRIEPDELSQLSVPLTALLGVVVAVLELRLGRLLPRGCSRERVGLYLGAALLFYISVSGLYARGMISMLRYNYCVHVLLLLAVIQLTSARLQVAPLTRPMNFWIKTFRLAVMVLAALQIILVRAFLAGYWVA